MNGGDGDSGDSRVPPGDRSEGDGGLSLAQDCHRIVDVHGYFPSCREVGEALYEEHQSLRGHSKPGE